MRSMERKEFYKPKVYDQERIKDSLKLMHTEQEDIDYYKRRLIIDQFFTKHQNKEKSK